MKILPANIEQQIAQVDRQKSLIIGISSGLVALWCAYRVFWALYLSMTYSFVFGSLIFPVVLWGVVGVVAGPPRTSARARPAVAGSTASPSAAATASVFPSTPARRQVVAEVAGHRLPDLVQVDAEDLQSLAILGVAVLIGGRGVLGFRGCGTHGAASGLQGYAVPGEDGDQRIAGVAEHAQDHVLGSQARVAEVLRLRHGEWKRHTGVRG